MSNKLLGTNFPLTRYALARHLTLWAMRVLPPGDKLASGELWKAERRMKAAMRMINRSYGGGKANGQ